MADVLLAICLALTVTAGGMKYRLRSGISHVRREIAELKAENAKVLGQRRRIESELAHTELRERELLNDCRDLSRELQHIEDQLRELGDVAERHMRRRDTPEAL